SLAHGTIIASFTIEAFSLSRLESLTRERITPVIAQRTERGLEQAAHKRSSRWRKILKESSQQCRRWRLPELTELEEFARALQRRDQFRYFFDESAAIPIMTQLPPRCTPDDTVSVLIGPEGGWTDPERQLAADAQWIPVSLGGRILRAETAATASLAVLQAAWSSSLPSSSTT
ncbi:MAG: RNA methyltransferase, partial [Candidatus Solibacter usitatus]|nr:RNA methyltransferase [Candidatus Solibacter usitatus]